MGKFSFVRHFDLLVAPYEFTVRKNQRSVTVLGGAISLGIFIFMVIYSISVYWRLQLDQNIIYAGTQSESELNYKLDQASTKFTIELSLATTGEFLESNTELSKYFRLDATYVQQSRIQDKAGFTRNYTSLEKQKCSNETVDSFNFQSQSFTKEQKSNLICFDGDYKISGSFYDPDFAYVKIAATRCQNTTVYQLCKSVEDIEAFLDQGINIDLFLQSSKIRRSLNLTHPADIYATNVFWRLNTGIGNSEDIYLAPIAVDQKKNSILPSFDDELLTTRIYTASSVKDQERRQTPIDIATVEEMCSFFLRFSPESEYYFINQSTQFVLFLQAVSQAAGLAFAGLGVVKVLYKFYAEHKTFETVMNNTFMFDLQNKSAQFNGLPNPSTPLSGSGERSNKNKRQKKKNELDNLYKSSLNYGFYQYIYFQFLKILRQLHCPEKFRKYAEPNQNMILAQMAKSKIQNDLDLCNIVQKLYEIDFLKLYLFNDQELLLFNSFCSPLFNGKMAEHQQDIKKLQQQNTRQFDRQHVKENYQRKNTQKLDVNYVVSSEFPMEMRLAKISRFFIAQLKAQDGEQLAEAFLTIMSEDNSQSSQKLIQFIKYNQTLYQLLKQTNIDNTKILESNRKGTADKDVMPKYHYQSSRFKKLRQQENEFDNLRVQPSGDYEPSIKSDEINNDNQKFDDVILCQEEIEIQQQQ